MPKRPVRLLVPVLALLVAACCALAAPASAYARDYEISGVTIDATVDANGALHVVETRTFDFDGGFNGVYWEIPVGRNEGSGADVDVTVLYAGEGTPGSLTAFEESDAGVDGTFEVIDEGDSERVKLYSAHDSEEATFTIAYDATGIVTRWEDTGELYWKFVSDGWGVESQNVTCMLHLPVPDGQSVTPGENVRAWGHGPLDASVRFDGDRVVFEVPGVGTEEFAEMRVAFPAEWVDGLSVTPGARLDTILSEEQVWAGEANERRAQARLAFAAALGLGGAVAVATLACSVWARLRYRRDFRPSFQDTYFRDVPTDDHPAVLGALFNGGDVRSKELTATLMRLTDEGVVRLERVRTKRKGLLGDKVKEECRLTKVSDAPSPDATSDPRAHDARRIDQGAVSLLFDTVADGGDAGDAAELLFSQIESFAREHPQRYSDAYESWAGAVSGLCLARFFGEKSRVRGKGVLAVCSAACVVALILEVIALIALDAPFYLFLIMGALLAGALIAALCVLSSLKEMSREAVEVKAKLEALERWLREFTRLEEAVPSDVVLWSRLLVMAVVLDVADEVIEQLRIARPEVLESPALVHTYGWLYWSSRGARTPAAALAGSLDSAHSVSSAALAESMPSSAGGAGGGFSGGGGGGFGGGGGGGAF